MRSWSEVHNELQEARQQHASMERIAELRQELRHVSYRNAELRLAHDAKILEARAELQKLIDERPTKPKMH